MAKGLTDSQLDALLAKGYISTDFYDSMKTAEDKNKALKTEAKQAESDFRVAENSYKNLTDMPPPSPAQVQDWTGLPPGQQPVMPTQAPAPVAAPPRTLEQTIAAANAKPQAPPAQPLNLPPVQAPANPLPKTPLNLDQVVGAKPAQPGQPSAEVVTPTGPLKLAVPQGYPNPYAGPTDAEKFLTPSEKARKTQLVEESNLKGDVTKRSVDLQMGEDQQIADIAKRQSQEYSAMIQQQNQVRAEENRIVQDNLNKLTQESKELGERKIDPNRAFTQLPTANKILAGIGMFLGAGGTRKGGANPAVETIQKHIDRDIAAQEFDIKNKGLSIDQRRGLLSDRMKQFGNLELARAAAKKDYLDVVDMQVKSVLAGNKSEKTRLAGDELLANLQEAKNKAMFDFSQLNDQRARQLAAQAAAAKAAANAKLYEDYKARRDSLLKVNEERIKAGLAPLDPTQLTGNKSYDYQPSNPEFAKNVGERSVTLPFDPYTGKPLPQPQQFQARTKEDADEIKKGNAAVQRVTRNIDQMLALREAHSGGGFTFPRSDVSKAQALRADTLLAIKEAEKTGALDEGSVDVIGGMIPEDPSAYGYGEDKLAQTRSIVLQNHQNRLQNRLTPASVSKLPASPEQLGAVKNK